MIYQLFPKLKKDTEIEGCEILSISVNKQKTIFNINIKFCDIISRKKISIIEQTIKKEYNLTRVTISPRYDDVNIKYLETVREFFTINYKSTIGFFKDSEWKIEENTITIIVKNDLETLFNHITSEMINLILVETGKNFIVNFISEVPQNIVDTRQDELRESIKRAAEEAPRFAPPPAASSPAQKPTYKPRKTAITLQEGEEIILGKPSEEPITTIEDLIADAGTFTIKGDVFFVEKREIPNRDLFVICMDITDYTSSVRVTRVMKKDMFESISDHIKVGIHVKIQGMLEFSTYDREHIFKPMAIVKCVKKERKDLENEKRVELHLHTNMSTMDGVCSISEYVEQAKKWGHSAIAVTDHGVVQAFPEAMNAGKQHGIKIIYGVEGYVFDDTIELSPVINEKDYKIDDEIVIFDLETTGLRSKTEEIIEICAQTFKNGVKVSEFHTYINPQRQISPKITEITGITDEIVANQPTIDRVIHDFVEYIGEKPLVAHNADFDMSFVYEACRRFNIDKNFTYIDTLTMSRIVLDHMSRHRLNTVAKALGLGNFEHHRATEDTRILASIFYKFVTKIREVYKIDNILDINTAINQMKIDKNIKKPARTYHLIIIAKNYIGLKNLYKIISSSHLEHYFGRPVIPQSIIDKYREGLIIGSACEAGELYSAILSCKNSEYIENIAKKMDFLEVQPLDNNKFLIEKEIVKSKGELIAINEYIIKLGEKLNIPVVATGDVHFKEPNDEVYRRVLMAGKGFGDADDQAPLYFKSTDEMLENFDYLDREKAYELVVKNPNLIADMCEDIRAVPAETFTPTIDGSAEELEFLSRQKVTELYGEKPEQLVIDRLEYELKSIIGNGFDVMYMIAQKLVTKSIECGYLVGSRGSVGSSFVAFLSGITEVNSLPAHYRCKNCKKTEFYPNQGLCGCDMPDKVCPECNTAYIKDGFDIPFATFLGFDGDKAPDIDLNFSGEYQERAHKHTEEIFGRENVFRAGTIGTIADKTAFGYVKKYAEERELILNRAEQNRISQGCTGVKRTTGQHPGGLMIVPKEKSIYDFSPVQHPADDQTTDTITTHFDYHSIHDNLLKLDLLGHDDPTIIKHLFELTGIDPQTIPLDDPETMKIFTDISALGIEKDKVLGKTGSVAVPEFGTKFVREMLMTTLPKTFDELVRISGLSHGTDVWLGNAKDLVVAGTASLKDVICARDDIMNFLISKGLEPKLSFTIMESVRKGKGLKPDWEENMRMCSVPDWYIDSCKKIKYMFPKAHAVAYVMMAFRIAWFKVHHPLAFYSAYFSIRAKSFDASLMTVGHYKIKSKLDELSKVEKMSNVEKDTYTTLEVCHEFYLRGFSFKPIDIYNSEVNNFKIIENSLLPPFTSMPGLGESAALSIIDERNKGKFLSVEELQMRCSKVSKGITENLLNAGALENIPKTTQIALF